MQRYFFWLFIFSSFSQFTRTFRVCVAKLGECFEPVRVYSALQFSAYVWPPHCGNRLRAGLEYAAVDSMYQPSVWTRVCTRQWEIALNSFLQESKFEVFAVSAQTLERSVCSLRSLKIQWKIGWNPLKSLAKDSLCNLPIQLPVMPLIVYFFDLFRICFWIPFLFIC